MHLFGETDSLQRLVGALHGQKLGLFRPLCATPRGKPFESLQPHTLPIAALVAADKCIPSARLTVSKGRLVRYMVRSWAYSATPRGKPFESLQPHMLSIAALVAVDK